MGNSKPEPKKKKKGRPSLLDLQKRNLRLQKQQEQHSQKTPNLNPNADDDDSSNETRREKKIKLVHRIDQQKDEGNNSSKGAHDNTLREENQSDLGPTKTPLPEKKLLGFVLDRLQKKDTYSVFSEPADPEELPYYYEIIKHPMDFATIRKKLSSGAYANLEQFEEDVFLISSNAMQYNAADTIYYRQARAIQELAKKNFENLRQESDDDQPEPKIVARRGRPPSKNIKRAIGRLEHASDSSKETLVNAGDGPHLSNLAINLSRKGSASERGGLIAVSTRSPYNLRQTEPYRWVDMHKSESIDEYSGYGSKGSSTKYGKKFPVLDAVIDENRRNTFHQPHPSAFEEPSILNVFDGERKQLMPNGLHIQHSYARSLAHFAANLGPIGWDIASRRIERVLPLGTKFGRRWIGDSEAPHHSQQSLISTSPPLASSSSPNVSTSMDESRGDKLPQEVRSPSNDLAREVNHLRIIQPPASISIASNRWKTMEADSEVPAVRNHESFDNYTQSKISVQLHYNLQMQSATNGYNVWGFNVPSKVGHIGIPTRPLASYSSDVHMTHSGALDMVSRSDIDSNHSFQHQPPMRNLDAESVKSVSVLFANSGHNQMKRDSVPPDLNVRFQLPGSPATQQPDLALPRWMKNIVARGI